MDGIFAVRKKEGKIERKNSEGSSRLDRHLGFTAIGLIKHS